MGELLRQFDGRGNNQYTKKEETDGDVSIQNKKQVAESIGLSERQSIHRSKWENGR